MPYMFLVHGVDTCLVFGFLTVQYDSVCLFVELRVAGLPINMCMYIYIYVLYIYVFSYWLCIPCKYTVALYD